MSGKTDKYIVKAEKLEDVIYHDIPRAEKELGPVFKYIEDSLFPGVNLVLRLRRVDQVPANYQPYIETHTHDVDQFYGATDGLTIEVIMENDRHEVTGPAAVRIPAGMKHTVRPLKGKGYLIVILKKGKYE